MPNNKTQRQPEAITSKISPELQSAVLDFLLTTDMVEFETYLHESFYCWIASDDAFSVELRRKGIFLYQSLRMLIGESKLAQKELTLEGVK